MNCPKCKSSSFVKNGSVAGRQRYKCKDCGYNYTVEQKSDIKSKETKRLALSMYLEGLGFRSIGRILNISHGTVYQWVKRWGEQVELPRSGEVSEIVELDEIHTYVESKKTTDGYGLLLIDLANGLSLLSVGAGVKGQGQNYGK